MIQRSRLLACLAVGMLLAAATYLAFEAGRLALISTENLSRWKVNYADILSRCRELEYQVSNLSQVITEKRNESANLIMKDHQLELVLRNCSNQKAILASTVNTLNQELAEKNHSIETLQEEVLRAKGALNETRIMLAQTLQDRDKYRSLYENASSKIAKLLQLVVELNSSLTELKINNNLLNSRLQNISTRLSNFDESILLPGEIYRTFTWNYLTQRKLVFGEDGKMGSGFNRTEYLLVATSKHYPDTDDEFFDIVLSVDSPDVNKVADELYSQGRTDLQRVTNILKFVQYLPYIWDYENHSYIRYPIETLVEGGGDCEDTSVLAARLMMDAGEEGFPVVLLTVDTNGDGVEDHMMVGVSVDGASGKQVTFNGRNYYACETTTTYYGVGSMPPGYEIVRVIPVGVKGSNFK